MNKSRPILKKTPRNRIIMANKKALRKQIKGLSKEEREALNMVTTEHNKIVSRQAEAKREKVWELVPKGVRISGAAFNHPQCKERVLQFEKAAIKARMQKKFGVAANYEMGRLIGILEKKGQISTVMDCMDKIKSDEKKAGWAKGVELAEERIKLLKQILHHYGYKGY